MPFRNMLMKIVPWIIVFTFCVTFINIRHLEADLGVERNTGTVLPMGPSLVVTFGLSSSGRQIALSQLGRVARILDANTGSNRFKVYGPHVGSNIAESYDGRYIAVTSNSSLTVWDVTHAKMVVLPPMPGDSYKCAAFVGKGDFVVIASTLGLVPIPHSYLTLVDLTTKKAMWTKPFPRLIMCLASCAASSIIVAGRSDNVIIVVDTKTGREHTLALPGKAEHIFTVAVSPDGNSAAVGTFNGDCYVLPIYSSKIQAAWNVGSFVVSLCFCDNGTMVAVSHLDSNSVQVFYAANGQKACDVSVASIQTETIGYSNLYDILYILSDDLQVRTISGFSKYVYGRVHGMYIPN
jgi:WD40 repeat protein